MIIVDPANNRAVVLAGEDVWLVDYTTADRLQVDSRRVRTLTFKEALTVGDQLTFETPSTGEGPNTYTLTNT